MKRLLIAVVLMVAVNVMAGPRPVYPYSTDAAAAKSLAELIQENPDTFEPIVKAAIGSGGASVAVDPVAAIEASRERGGIMGHLRRNWGKYTAGVATGTAIWYGNKRDWWQDDERTSISSEITNTGHSINVSTGNDSPVTINIGVSESEE